MSVSAASLHVPVFLTQLSQKTLLRLGIDTPAWERFVSRVLERDLSAGVGGGDAMEAFVDYASFRRLVRLAQRMLGSETLLRWYTADMRLVHLGPLGVAALTAPTVGDSVAVWQRHGGLLSPTLQVCRRDTAHQVILAFRADGASGVDRLLAELHLLTLKRQIEYVARCPGAVTVRLAGAPVASPAFYAAEFGNGVTFGAGDNLVLIPRGLLDAVNDAHVPLVWRHALGLCAAMNERARSQVSLVHRVRETLLQGAARGDVGQREVAARLNMSMRTLARRLADTGVSFRDLQMQIRMEVARRQLRETRLPIKVICGNAGFSNLSAFSRAFRRANAVSPSAFRASA